MGPVAGALDDELARQVERPNTYTMPNAARTIRAANGSLSSVASKEASASKQTSRGGTLSTAFEPVTASPTRGGVRSTIARKELSDVRGADSTVCICIVKASYHHVFVVLSD